MIHTFIAAVCYVTNPFSGEISNHVFPCHLIDNINTIFCGIVRFDRFWDFLALSATVMHGWRVLRMTIFYWLYLDEQ